MHVAQAIDASLGRRGRGRERLVNDGSYPANDQVPVVTCFYWNDWLYVQNILCAISGIDPKIVVVLTGTLIRLATGFCAAFLNASAFSAAAGVVSVAT